MAVARWVNISGIGRTNTQIRSMGRFPLLFLSFALILALPAMALADTLTVSNTLVTNTDTSKAPGDTGTANVWLEVTNGAPNGDVNGCNVTSALPGTVTFSSNNPAVTFPQGNTVQLTDCSAIDDKTGARSNVKSIAYKVADNAAAGQAVLSATVSGGKSGSKYLTTDTLTVTITAPAKQNTTVALDPTSGTYGGNATLKATLKTGGHSALSGKTVDFKLNGNAVGSATTGTDGVATKSVSLSDINAGAYTHYVSANFAGDTSNNGSTASGDLTVDKAQATLTLNGLGGHTYNGSPQGATATTSPAGLGGVSITYDGSTQAPTDAGSYAVVASLTNPNYQAQDATGTLVIDKATPQITWGAPNDITYGTQLGAEQLNASSDVPGSFSYTPASGAKLDAGDGQDLRADFTPANPGNYNTASKTVKIDVNKADQSITFGALPDKTYGDAGFAADASADSGLDVSLGSATPAKCSINDGSVSILEAGTCTIEASQGGNANYNAATSVSRSFEIAKKALTVTANDEIKTYGDPNPSFTVRYSDDFVNGDTAASLGGTLGFDTGAAQGSPVGEYGVTPKGLTSGNYALTFRDGTLTINKADLTVRANDASREYGQANPAFGASYSGFKNGDDASMLGGTLAFDTNATVTSPAGGAYYVRPSGLTSGNYNIAFADGKLTVDKARAEISLGGLDHTYDATAKAATVQISPEPAAQSATRKALSVTYDGQASQPSSAGSYAVVASLDDDNYVAEDARGTLTIAKAALTVKADDKSRTYGDENPNLTGTLTGVKGADGITASYSTAATAASNAGTYAIVPSLDDPDGKLSNYLVTETEGTLTIGKAALSARADDKGREYGEANPNLTGTLTGVKNGDAVNASYSTPADAGSEVGTYAIVPTIDASEEVLANYEQPVLTNGKLTVGKAPLTIKAENATRQYGAADPTFTGSIVSGAIKNSDAVSLAFSTQATAASNVGPYAIVPSLSGTRASNYDVTAQNGTLTITKAPATITLSDLEQVYDGTAKAARVTTDPDSPNKQITVTYDGARQAPTNAGSYSVVASLNDANYEAKDATGTLVIAKAPASINLDGLDPDGLISKTYDGSPQRATATTTPAGLAGVSFTYDGNAQAPTNTGRYAVIAKLNNPNYVAENATGTLDIAKAQAQINLSDLNHTYDGTVKAAKATTTHPAGLNVDLSYSQGVNAATPRDAGNYDVVAQINDANYRGSATGTLNIARASQAITFGALGPKTLGDPDFNVSATGGDSGNPVTFAAAGSCTISGNTVRITAIGACEITASQAGNANYGDASPVKQSFRINYRFAGYRAPVDNGGVFNVAKAGSSIPMKFSLFGNQGLNIIEAGFPKATAINCTTSATTDAIEETTTANSGLTYDATADQYNYVWKTPSTYSGKCFKFDMVLKDGTSHTALFKFTR
ncbi:MAG: hypothetical protein AVDCRST_MAG03-3368 [uncultured Rubrobacteraceae bacterium]|uniref:Uncharacterized protein n=1 Tax=uncultured Rubrobacteraceae bacterium TaxID=349277 RepID=A0A6J4Q2Q0_9ACTN|nr:MAG: hypothetical protein AVDCRST_MAG03-3368 [uncultured Rubrobacteraceae bacterium]